MSRLFKFALLLLLLNTSVFADRYVYYFITETNQPKKYSYTGDINSYIRVGNDIFKSKVIDNIEYLNSQDNYDKSSVFYRFGNDNAKAFIFLDQEPKKVGCWTHYGHDTFQNKADCDEPWYQSSNATKLNLHAFKFLNLEKVATCQPDEHFNTETKQCQKCPEGYSWNPATNKCYKDCSDAKKNMYGWDDGSCTNCSHAKTTADVYRCFCGGLGLGVPNEITDPGFPNGGKCGRKGACLDGYQFEYTDPECKEDKDPKPDDNSTKPQDPDTPDNPKDPKDPKPNPDNPNPNPDGPKPDPDDSNNEFCKKNPNDPKCKDDYCKKNPKDPKCKKDTNSTKPGGPGGGGGGDNDGKDKDAKFDPKDFDYNDIEKEVNGFKDTILKHYNEMNSKFDDFKRGYNQLINNIQGKGFSAIKGQSSSSSCPKVFKIDMGYNVSKTVYIDICKEFSKLKSTFYYIFYLFFFCFFLFLTIKLTIPLMVNQFKYI